MSDLTAYLSAHESTIRLTLFVCIFCVMAAAERRYPARVATQHRGQRWLNNLALMLLNSLVLRLVFPVAALGFAHTAHQLQWGLLNRIELPLWLTTLTAILVLDLCIYIQHVAFHRIPLFWRLHRVHHLDKDVDVTTAARFHTLEIILSMAIKGAVICALGAPVLAVLIFETLLSASATFNHANIRFSQPIDAYIRRLIVTPNMHRIHHSTHAPETNSNYGFCLTWWDKIFNTYTTVTPEHEKNITLGLHAPTQNSVHLFSLLLSPFKTKGNSN